ncbi:MAG: cbb3-type cytochrome c oxidase subunit 3 [Candidatus Sericytochromatia bacterium]|nr:cbb3-type cytochrome c oxidase subunit 3 [Candidatus Sericytochromatia bacterium]
MFELSLVALSKIIALVIFFPIYLGALAYVLVGPDRATFERYARIPLEDAGA